MQHPQTPATTMQKPKTPDHAQSLKEKETNHYDQIRAKEIQALAHKIYSLGNEIYRWQQCQNVEQFNFLLKET